MADDSVTMPRARYETLMRLAIAARDTSDALLSALNAEVTGTATDPRAAKPNGGRPATFGRPSQPTEGAA